MTTSEQGIALIKKFEGLYLKAYQDRVGVWTIGYGTTSHDKSITGKSITKGMTITKETAEKWLRASLRDKYEPKVSKYDSIYHWTQAQFDALVSFCYNIGDIDQLTANGQRTLNQVRDHIKQYNHAGGKVVKGLTERREAEYKLFCSDMGRPKKCEFPSVKMTVTNDAGANLRVLPSTQSRIASVVRKGTDISVLKNIKAINSVGGETEYVCVFFNGEYLWATKKLFE
jgi:GH24 family phage-related lysozyme (muramidase)